MLYIIIVLLTICILVLFNRIRKLETQLDKSFRELRDLKENTVNVQAYEDVKSYVNKKRKRNVHSSKELNETKNGNSNLKNILNQEEIIWQNQNKIPSEYLYPKKNLEDKSHFFYGKKIVITGKFDNFPVRPELAKYLWDIGADIDRGVGPNLDYLFCGDDCGDRKVEKCEEQGIEILYEEDIIELLPNFKSKFL